jgi:hypothetical protein
LIDVDMPYAPSEHHAVLALEAVPRALPARLDEAA